MSITLNAAVTNNGDLKTIFEFSDKESDELIDFTGATIEIDIKDFGGCPRIQASTSNGKVTIVSVGRFELDIPVGEMACLCPGSYAWGGVFSLNGETISLFTGTLAIVAGNARL